jgi:hypothetical protein
MEGLGRIERAVISIRISVSVASLPSACELLTRIDINGDNPAVIHIGDTSNELCATITGPQANVNLGIKTFLKGHTFIVWKDHRDQQR